MRIVQKTQIQFGITPLHQHSLKLDQGPAAQARQTPNARYYQGVDSQHPKKCFHNKLHIRWGAGQARAPNRHYAAAAAAATA